MADRPAQPPPLATTPPRGAAAGALWAGLLREVRRSLAILAGWVTSAAFHLLILLVLGLLLIPESEEPPAPELSISTKSEIEEVDILEDPVQELTVTDTSEPSEILMTDSLPEEMEVEPQDAPPSLAMAVELHDLGWESVPEGDLLSEIKGLSGRGLEGRGEAARKVLVARGGGNVASEAAVARGLDWLARHQYPDGGWSFEHHRGACQGRCGNPGNMRDARNAATAMALLPFLGAGQTHLEGKYRKVVHGGLQFLSNRFQPHQLGPNLMEPGGRMYAHALATIVLCEAYAMTEDRRLHVPAQQAIAFIVAAQDKQGGGWRYYPGEAGDTSVVGWQFMALKSGQLGYLQFPTTTVVGAERFLNSVAAPDGTYGYTSPSESHSHARATTAIGLLCRMYLGWGHDHPMLQRGVQLLSEWGPSENNFYYNYYATQVMHHYGGEKWEAWNKTLRDQLIESQVKEGHETGSWYVPEGDHGSLPGGRLYFTSLGTMILEVYYRHLPLYGKGSVEAEFDR